MKKELLSFISTEVPRTKSVKAYDVKKHLKNSLLVKKVEEAVEQEKINELASIWLRENDVSTIGQNVAKLLKAGANDVDAPKHLDLALESIFAMSLLGEQYVTQQADLSNVVQKYLTSVSIEKGKKTKDSPKIKLIVPSTNSVVHAVSTSNIQSKESIEIDEDKESFKATSDDHLKRLNSTLEELAYLKKEYALDIQEQVAAYDAQVKKYNDFWDKNFSEGSEDKEITLLESSNKIHYPDPLPLKQKQLSVLKRLSNESNELIEFSGLDISNEDEPLHEVEKKIQEIKYRVQNERLAEIINKKQNKIVFYNGTKQKLPKENTFDSEYLLGLNNNGVSNGRRQPAKKPYPIFQLLKGIHRTIESELKCYKPTEIAKITNVLKGELYQNTDRINQERVVTEELFEEDFSSRTEENSSKENSEFDRRSQESAAFKTGASLMFGAAGVVAGIGEFSTEASAFLDVSTDKSTEESSRFAEEYSKKLVEETKKTKRQTEKTINTFSTERVIRSALDNREGDEHVIGIYRHVEKIEKSSLIKHGQKYMLDLMIPDPALYIRSQLGNKLGISVDMNPVINPAELSEPIRSAADIHEGNYLALAALYEVNVKAPPVEEQSVLHSFSIKPPTGGESVAANAEELTALAIPEGYKLSRWIITAGFLRNGSGTARVRLAFHKKRRFFDENATQEGNFVTNKVVKLLPISFSYFFGKKDITATCSVVIKVERTNALLKEWKQEVYMAIVEGYKALKSRYKNALELAEIEARSQTFSSTSPAQNRIIERQELQKLAISMLSGRNLSGFDDTLDPYGINLRAQTKEHGELILFLQTAFEWPLMNWLHYPYFWKEEQKWQPLAQDAGSDPAHQAFLNAGYSRCLVSIRPGYEKAALYFLQTGKPWSGNNLEAEIDLENLPVDERYLPLWEEIMSSQGQEAEEPIVEKTWEVSMPTNLIYLQKESELDLCDEVGVIDDYVNTSDETTVVVP